MKKKEIAALGLSVALSMTGCASQTDVDALNNQIAELSAEVESLQTELNDAQSEFTDASQKNTELEKQVAELQEELTSLNEEFTVDEEMIADAAEFADNASINVTKYSQKDTAVYSKANESEEYKIANLDMNSECYVVATFSDVNNEGIWSAIASLVTVDEAGNKTYEIISSATKGSEKSKNKNIDFMMRQIATITVDGKTIKADDLAENQEIRIVYARTSLLSNSKVTEQQHTSAEKSSTPQQTQQQGSSTDGRIPGADYSWWDNTPSTTPGCPSMTGMNIQFH